MRRAVLATSALALTLGLGCPPEATTAPQPQPQPSYQPQPYPPGYQPYYPPQQPYYPPQPQPSYQPQPQPYPQPGYPPQPAPSQQPQPQPQPQPAPSQQPYNPWNTLLSDLLKGAGAPPIPWPLPPQPQPQPPPQPQPTPSGIDPRGLDLANAINTYRAQNGLPAIPISKSLAKVADTHVHDLARSPKLPPQCNAHSWSSAGSWTACCYTADHAQAKCMWYKPSEITGFKGTGFEIAIGQPGVVNNVTLDSKQAIQIWQGSQLHNEVILNRGQWASMTWRAMGAGIIDSHASAWFSDTADTTP